MNSPLLGRCIYCLDNKIGMDELKDEHVWPSGLHGKWQIRKASCGECEKITSAFERVVIREMFGAFRARVMKPVVRRKDQRKSTHPITLSAPGKGFRRVAIPKGKHHGTVVMPYLDPPTLLAGPRPLYGDGMRPVRYFGWTQAHDLSRLLKTFQGENIHDLGYVPYLDYVRFIAKVAYSGAFLGGRKGWRFRPLLNDLILGKSKEHEHLVGGAEALAVKWAVPKGICRNTYQVETLANGTRYLVAYLRFFADIVDGPVYRVVVGRMVSSRWQEDFICWRSRMRKRSAKIRKRIRGWCWKVRLKFNERR